MRRVLFCWVILAPMFVRVLISFLYQQYRRILLGFALLFFILWGLRFCRRDTKDWRFVSAFGIRLPMHYALHGIDVSRHNSRINWGRIRALQADGVRLEFVFIKATEGATLADPTFQRNWQGAKEAGLHRGAYHFFHPTRDPVKQANNFIRHVELTEGDFVPVLDFEVINGQPDANILRDLRIWLDLVEAHYHVRPMIYTNDYLYNRFIKTSLGDYPLWIADYSNTHLRDYNADKLYLWQHNKRGWVDGIQGQVDFNAFVQDPDNLDEILL